MVQKLGIPLQCAQYTLECMRTQFPEASVTGYRNIVGAMPVNPKDRHVVAAALVGRAQLILTSNIRDFPAADLRPFQIEALTPDDFLADLAARYPAAVRDCVAFMAAQTGEAPGKPRLRPYEILQAVGTFAPKFAEYMLLKFEIT